MITLYSGTPGSGKSLRAVMRAYDRVHYAKLPVIANFRLAFPKYEDANRFHYWDNEDISPKALIEFSKEYFEHHRYGENKILLILDECQLVFNSRTSIGNRDESKKRMGWIEFFSQHRKYGYEVIMIAQFDRMIDRQIRSLIEYEDKFRKVSNFGWKGFLLSLVMGGTGTFVQVHMFYSLREKLSSSVFHARKKYFSLYDTRAAFEQA